MTNKDLDRSDLLNKEFIRLALQFQKSMHNMKMFKELRSFNYMLTAYKMRKKAEKDFCLDPRMRLNPSGKKEGIMFIGTNPSIFSNFENVWEDKFGQFFLRQLIASDINPKEVWMTNLFKYPTPGNRPLNEKELIIGLQELLQEIRMVDPLLIVPMGKQVLEVFKMKKGEYARNLFIEGEFYCGYGIHHPSYIQRFQTEKNLEEFRKDLSYIKTLCVQSF